MAFGLAYERAVLAWFDSLPEELTGGSVGEAKGGGAGGELWSPAAWIGWQATALAAMRLPR